MQCPECQFENPDNAKFCIECSNPMEFHCPNCGAITPATGKFCQECAYNLSESKETPSSIDYSEPKSYTPKFLADKILTNRNILEGERKLLTVLFADVANYTAMAEKLDPEQVHQIMDGCFKILMDEIHQFQGTINQFTGDGVMALFGAPLALENHTRKACQASLAIQKALESHNKMLDTKFGVTFKMRVGLNSGPVVVGSIGDDLRMDYTAIGDTTNLAARIQNMAKPGTVLVSQNIYKEVKQLFELNSLGKTYVKGKEESVEIYELKGEKFRPQVGLTRKIYSEMVGRDKELNTLKIQVLKAINGEGSVLNIIGEAGIGKSRLVAELKNQEEMKGITLIEGRAISIGRNLSFHPIIDLFKQWARIRENDDDSAAFNRLENAVRSLYPEEIDEVLPFVATLMGMRLYGKYSERVKGIEGEALEKLILISIRKLLIKAAGINPLAIVVEDLHWADTSSIELMESLFRLAETQRIIFINLFRPGNKETGDRILKTLKEKLPVYYIEIVLESLDDRLSETLITNMLDIKGLPHSVSEQIVERAGGNPFFIEEVVRSLIDEGAVASKDGSFKISEKIDNFVIPHTISDILMSRIDRLEEKTHNLVKIASVIGRSFFYRILVEVAKTIEDIDKRLGYLKEIQLIRERMRLKELEYLFKHALAQEAAYESILLEKRKKLHLKVADSIETVFKGRLHEFYGMLAFHYSRGEDLDKAEKYLIQAGEMALKSSASSEALHYYQKALNLYLKKYGNTADPEKIALLEKNIAIALYNKGYQAESVNYFKRVLSFYGLKDSKFRILILMKFLSGFLNLILAFYLPLLKWKRTPTKIDSEILSLCHKKASALVNVDPKRFFIEALIDAKFLTNFDISKEEFWAGMVAGYSTIFSWTGISFTLSRRILDFVKSKIIKDDYKSQYLYKTFRLMHSVYAGEWDTIYPHDENLSKLMYRTGETRNILTYLCQMGVLYIEKGYFHKALDMTNKISELAIEYENDFFLAFKYVGRSLLFLKYRKLKEAMEEAQEGIDFTTKKGIKMQSFCIHTTITKIKAIWGDINGAKSHLKYADEIRHSIKVAPPFLSEYYLSSFYTNLNQMEEFIRNADEYELKKKQKKALKAGKSAVKASLKSAPSRTEAYRLMGIYYWVINKQSTALKWLNKSIEKGEELNARLELSRTYFEVGKRLLDPKSKYKKLNGFQAEEYLDKARILFKEIDLQWDLDELDRLNAYSKSGLS